MPTYQLRCRKCSTELELESSLREYERKRREQALTCPKCGSNEVSPEITRFEVQTASKT